MEVTYYEDPACSWCWAFEPVATAFAFEFGHLARFRHVMGGLRDRPPVDVAFVIAQWRKAASLFRMPFDVGVWDDHVLQTTHIACRAVKAATIISPARGARLLRRLREAYFAERTAIDSFETIARLAVECGIGADELLENVASGRADDLFERDRSEANAGGFGFPTTILSRKKQDHCVMLQGSVDYAEMVNAAGSLGYSEPLRRRFQDTPEHWLALFEIHPRLAPAEVRLVTQCSGAAIAARAQELGIHWTGVFYELRSAAPSPLEPAVAATARSELDGLVDGELDTGGKSAALMDAGDALEPKV